MRCKLFLFFALMLLAPPVWAAGEFLVATGTYTGNGSTQTVTISPSFTPIAVLIKENTAAKDAHINLSCTDLTFALPAATRGFTGGVTACGAGTFSVSNGSSSAVNADTKTYYYVAFGAGTGISTGSYVGNAPTNDVDVTISPAFQPGFLIIRGHDTASDNARGMWRSADIVGDLGGFFIALAPIANTIKALNSNGFRRGTHANVNTSGITYYYLAIQDVAGHSASGHYTGNGGGSNPSVTTGFQPDFFMTKSASAGDLWAYRFGSQTGTNSFQYQDAQAANIITAFNATTVGLGTAESVNHTGNTYSWWAVKSSPALTTQPQKGRMRVLP